MNKKIYYVFILFLVALFLVPNLCVAQPYGTANYGNVLPYGSETSLSISTSGDVAIEITPSESGTISKGSSVVTVTSNDVAGYKLYIKSPINTFMENGSFQIPASEYETPTPLTVNSWGYNMDGSDNFIGIKSSDALIRSNNSLVLNGEDTTVTFGIKVDMEKASGTYQASVVYTAIPQTY